MLPVDHGHIIGLADGNLPVILDIETGAASNHVSSLHDIYGVKNQKYVLQRRVLSNYIPYHLIYTNDRRLYCGQVYNGSLDTATVFCDPFDVDRFAGLHLLHVEDRTRWWFLNIVRP